jgi:hypothetical protein
MTASKKKSRQKTKTSSTLSFNIQDLVRQRFGISEAQYNSIVSFEKLKGAEKLKQARQIIAESIIDAKEKPDQRCALAIAESESLLKGYATLDDPHRAEIANLIAQITAYLHDATRKRPFNALMLASPGAGKSHFIKQLAGAMKDDRVQAVTFNMATMQSSEDMAQPVDDLRNLKVNDRFPLLFLDEFDSDPSRYAALLPLLWEGAFHTGHRDLRLGKAVIVLAGSNPDLPKAMNQSAQMRLDASAIPELVPPGKLIDLLSRINGGVIEIPDFDLRTEDRDRRVDKVCVAIALLKDRFGSDLAAVPRSLLRFIAHTKFRYGVRSVAHLIDIIDSRAFESNLLNGTKLGFPTDSEGKLEESSLSLHLLDKDQAFGIVSRWKEFAEDKTMVDLNQKELLRFPFEWGRAG